MKDYILSIDAGTTGLTTIVIDKKLRIIKKCYSEINQYFPKKEWVEHNPSELINKINKHLAKIDKTISLSKIKSIGITNQRETVVVWNKKTGIPVYNAIVWQCRRTKNICKKLKQNNKDKTIYDKTGLMLDSYFSATKIQWIIKNIKNINKKEILAGTIDTWIIWNLTNKKHYTDHTNASRTMLYNINSKKWDSTLLDLFKIPKSILPEIKNSIDNFGTLKHNNYKIPIYGVAGDQQAALFGQGGIKKGSGKCTYGTGLFYLQNIGNNRLKSRNNLINTIAINENGKPIYAIEGSVFIGGAIIQWIRDELGIINNASETEVIAKQVGNNGGIYIVPAFAGLGAPYWNSSCNGIICGLTRGSNKNHIIRASLESITYQVNDLLECIKKDTGITVKKLNVDGGAAKNNFLLQFQSNISNIQITRPKNIESTSIGAAILAGIKSKLWSTSKEAFKNLKIDKQFEPKIDNKNRKDLISGWKNAVKKCEY